MEKKDTTYRVKPKFYYLIKINRMLLDRMHNNSEIYEYFKSLFNNRSPDIIIETYKLSECIDKYRNHELKNENSFIICEIFDKHLNISNKASTFFFLYLIDNFQDKNNSLFLRLIYPFNYSETKINLNKHDNSIVFHTASTRASIPDIAYVQMERQNFTIIGYHFVILENGTIVYTRPTGIKGAHTWGFNDSLSICFARNLNQTRLSKTERNKGFQLLKILTDEFNIKHVYGHDTATLELLYTALSEAVLSIEKRYEKALIQNDIEVIRQIQEDVFKKRIRTREQTIAELLHRLNQSTLSFTLDIAGFKITVKRLIERLKDCPGRYFPYKNFIQT